MMKFANLDNVPIWWGAVNKLIKDKMQNIFSFIAKYECSVFVSYTLNQLD